MANPEIHINDIGTVFELTVKDSANAIVDLSTATVLNITFKKSDDTIVTKTASLVTDGTDGKMQYITVAGDLDLVGLWKIQGDITSPSWTGTTNIDTFTVYPNLV